MRKHVGSLLRAMVIVPILHVGSHAQESSAQMRSYVSGLGSDGNACTPSAPCKTLQAAVARTIPGGEIYVLDSADYGPVTIKKAITITSEGAVAGVLTTTGTGITIEAGPTDVVNLRGLDIDGGNTGSVGVHFKSGLSLIVQKSAIRGFTNTGINYAPNTNSNLYVADTNLIANNSVGLLVSSNGSVAVKAALHRIVATSNGVGIAVSGSTVNVAVSDAIASHNTYGIGANASTVMIRNATVSNNQVGIAAEQNAAVRVGQSTITANTSGLQIATGGQVQSYGNNNISGNTADGTPTSTVALQ